MRVLRVIINLGILLLLGGVLGGEVEAQWQDLGNSCNQTNGEFDIPLNAIKNKNPSETFHALKQARICMTETNVEIISYSPPATSTSHTIRYCGGGKVVPINGNNAPLEDAGEYILSFCCPADLPVNIGATGYGGCCPRGSLNNSNNKCKLPDGSIEEPNKSERESPSSIYVNQDTLSPFRIGGELLTCNPMGCLVRNGAGSNVLLSTNQTLQDPLSQTEISDGEFDCIAPNTTLKDYLDQNSNTVIGEGFVCLNQKAVESDVAGIILANPGATSCLEISNPDEKTRCLDCLSKNIEALNDDDPETQQSYVYSSLGCIDTSRDPFITRIFQLGFGLLTGIAVIKLMMVGIKLQSDDPSKHQEAREEAMAVLIALVTLGAAVPILQYIGINLLSILPIGFLR